MFIATELLSLLSFLTLGVWGIPAWDGGLLHMKPATSIGSILPGATFIEAIGVVSRENYRPKYLSVAGPKGVPTSPLIHENPSPPLFFINNEQLYQVTNETTVFRVNLLNVTGTEPHGLPYKLDLNDKKEGLTGGTWRWQSTRLFYDLGKKTNGGLFYSCPDKQGKQGVYMSLDPTGTPEGCKYHTLHSWVQRHQ